MSQNANDGPYTNPLQEKPVSDYSQAPTMPLVANPSTPQDQAVIEHDQTAVHVLHATIPPPPLRRRGKDTTIVTSILAVVIIISSSIFSTVIYNNHQKTLYTQATATAQIIAQATQAQINVQNTAITIASTYPFSNKVLLNDPMVDNSQHVKWGNNQSTGCYFSGSAYHVIQADSTHYTICTALGSNYSDFTFETEMVIKTGGSTAAGGLLFRADENNSKYYRLSIDATGFYFILAVVDSTGTSGNARELNRGTASSFSVGLDKINTLAIVAHGSQYTFYVNRQLVTTFTDTTYTHGQIGFDADYGSSPTELVFTNVKVWQLP